jgi:chromosome segregation and condensation protein ScpB
MVKSPLPFLDTELSDLTPSMRRSAWMARIEAVLFQSNEPVGRDILARVVGRSCNIDELVEEIQGELTARPYEIVFTAGGYLLRTRAEVGPAIHHALRTPLHGLTPAEGTVLMTIAYFQPITRTEIGWIIGKKISGKDVDRELLAKLRRLDLIATGPRSGEPGAPPMYVTTSAFLTFTFCETIADLPDWERLEANGMINKAKVIAQRKALAKSLERQDSLPEIGEEEAVEPLADM